MNPFLKLISEEDHKNKTGLNIAVICDYNIAGQMTGLMRAINKYSPHKARCIILKDDYMSYDKDIILTSDAPKSEGSNLINLEESKEIIDKADFYFFGRYVFNWSGVEFNNLLNRNNCCIAYYGSYLREHTTQCRQWHRDTGFYAIGTDSWILSSMLDFSFQHLPTYFTDYGDGKELSKINKWESGKLRIFAGSGNNPRKGYSILEGVINDLGNSNLELIRVSGKTNQETLKIKESCHVTYTSISGAWGVSGVESMWLGHTVLSYLDPYILSFYPDTPVIPINIENLEDILYQLGKGKIDIYDIGCKSREFAKKYFMNDRIVAQYLYIIDLIMNDEGYKRGLPLKYRYKI